MIVPLWGSFILHFNARLVKTIFPFQRQSGTFHNFHLIFFPPNWQNMSIFNVELKTKRESIDTDLFESICRLDLFTTAFDGFRLEILRQYMASD